VKAVVLISDGIDSPVAAYMMHNLGMELVFLHMVNDKSDVPLEKVKKIIRLIDAKSKLFKEDHMKTQRRIAKTADKRYQCVLCKRAMLRVAEKVAIKTGADYIVVGDNLGQVASQTLDNLSILDQAVKIPVLRPLLGFDKNEIVQMARKMGTYDISLLDAPSCRFVPKNPTTKAKLSAVLRMEK